MFLNSLNISNNINKYNTLANKSAYKLSSGKKINSAADNPSGLVISEKMRQQIKALSSGSTNITSGKSLLDTADAQLESITNIAQDISEAYVQRGGYEEGSDEYNTISNQIATYSQQASQLPHV